MSASGQREILVEPAYAEALKQENVEPFAAPKLELVQLEFTEKPFIFKSHCSGRAGSGTRPLHRADGGTEQI